VAVITLKIVVPSIEQVLDTFTQIKIYRSTTGISGTYSELTTPSTRLTLDPAVSAYEFVDEAGDQDYYYKSSYFNPTSALESGQSEAIQGEGDPALDIMSVAELKEFFLFGLDLTNDAGEDYPDSLFEFAIKAAVSWAEMRLDIPIRPKTITDEKHDYYREDYEQYIWINLYHYPLLAVDSVKLVLPGEVVVQDFPADWIHPDKLSGQLQLLPGTGSIGTVMVGAAGTWMPLIYGGARRVPDAFRVSYTAGLEEVPPMLKELIGKRASFGPLNIAGDLLGGAGIASQNLSMDGLSMGFNTTSSATNAGYGARLLQYSKEIKELLPMLHKYFKGLRITVV